MKDFLICSAHDVTEDGKLDNLIIDLKNLSPKIILWWTGFEYELPSNINIDEFYKLESIVKEIDAVLYFIFGSVENEKHKEIYPTEKFKYLYWPTFLLSQTYQVIKNNGGKSKLEEYHIEKDFKNLFISYNHNPHLHRCMLMDKLYGNDLFKYGRLSWNKLSTDYYINYEFQHWKEDYMKVDEYVKNGFRVEISDTLLEPKSLFNLISETDNEYLIFSEKTWRTILIEHPFLCLGAQYQNLKLKEYGFKLYDEIFDYSFDEKPNLEDRVDGIIKNIVSLKDRDYDELYSLIEEKVKFNKNRALEIIENDPFVPEKFVNLFKQNKYEFNFKVNNVVPHYMDYILKNK